VNLATHLQLSSEWGPNCMKIYHHVPYNDPMLDLGKVRIAYSRLLSRWEAKELTWKTFYVTTNWFLLFKRRLSGVYLRQANSRCDRFACEMSDLSCRTPGCVIYLGGEVDSKFRLFILTPVLNDYTSILHRQFIVRLMGL
jgi:hypothetical protein